MMHMCERCRRRSKDGEPLQYFEPTDQYLCDNCYVEAAKEHAEFLRDEERYPGE